MSVCGTGEANSKRSIGLGGSALRKARAVINSALSESSFFAVSRRSSVVYPPRNIFSLCNECYIFVLRTNQFIPLGACGVFADSKCLKKGSAKADQRRHVASISCHPPARWFLFLFAACDAGCPPISLLLLYVC